MAGCELFKPSLRMTTKLTESKEGSAKQGGGCSRDNVTEVG